MFLARRPSAAAIDRFLRDSRGRPFSYAPIGITREAVARRRVDDVTVPVGRGEEDCSSGISASGQ